MGYWNLLLRNAVVFALLVVFSRGALAFDVTPSPASGPGSTVGLSWPSQNHKFSSSGPSANIYRLVNGSRTHFKTVSPGTSTATTLMGLSLGNHSFVLELCGRFSSGRSGGCFQDTFSYRRYHEPTGPVVTSISDFQDNSITVTASVKDASEFQFRSRYNGANWIETPLSEANNKSYTLRLFGTYDFQVKGCNAQGCSNWSSTRSITPSGAISSPGSISVAPGSNTTEAGQTAISWSAATGAEFYRLQPGVVEGSTVNWSWPGEIGGKRFDSSSRQTEFNLGSGTYRFRVTACKQIGTSEFCSLWRTSSNFTVTLAAGFNLVNAPDIFRYDINETNAATFLGSGEFVAITQGAYSVAGGAVSYSVPIKAPPSINDLAPSVSLNYSSQNNSRGLLGVGWTIGGMSSISRCSTTFATEGAQAQKSNPRYSQGDRLCLNGQKLVLRNASNPLAAANPTASDSAYWNTSATYGTELENFMRVRHNPNGSGFIAEAKSGLIYYYGTGAGTEDIHYRAGHYGSDVAEWVLGKVEDRYGNSYTLNYQFDNATHQHNVDWIALTPNASIDFTYEERGSDYSSGFDKGTLYINTQRLASITTYIDTSGGATSSTPVTHYQIDYTQSPITDRLLVDAISECGFDVFGNQKCAKPLEFDWSEPDVGFEFNPTTREECDGEATVENAGCRIIPEQTDPLIGGKTGSSTVITPQGVGKLVVSTVKHPSNSTVSISYIPPASLSHLGTVSLDAVTWGDDSPCSIGPIQTTLDDFNNDGLTDFHFGNHIWLQNPNGNPANPFVKQAEGSKVRGFGSAALDRNSDGLLDIVDLRNSGGTTVSGFNFGRNRNHVIYGPDGTNKCTNHFELGQSLEYETEIYFGDFNGDGLTDISGRLNNGDFGSVQHGYVPIVSRVREFDSNGKVTYGKIAGKLILDIDRDGFSDIGRRLARVNADGEVIFKAPGVQHGSSPVSVKEREIKLYRDYDGDGYLDRFSSSADGVYIYLQKRGQPDMLTRVTDGFGAVTEFEYSELVNDVNAGELLYKTDFLESVYPYRTVNRSMQVLKKLSVSNGIGGKNHTYYNYEGGRIDVRGRGFTGFEKITVTDAAADRRITTNFRIDWPFNGRVKSQEVTSIAGEKITAAEHFYKLDNVNSRLVVKDREVIEEYNLETSPIAARELSYSYDSKGSISQKVTLLAPELVSGSAQSNWTHKTSEIFGFTYDLSNWLLGIPESGSVTNLDSAMTDVREISVSYVPEAGTKDIKTTIRFPGKAFESTTTVERNAQGIVTNTTTTAVDNYQNPSTERASSLHDFEDIIYPTRAKNALGHESVMGYDKRFGEVDYARDPNELESFKTFDALGRSIEEVGPLGTVTRQINYYCDFAPVSCPEYGAYISATVITHPEEGTKLASPLTIQYHDSSQRVIQTEIFLIDGSSVKQDTHYDSKGRLQRVSEPYTLFPMFYTEYGNYNALGEAQLIQVADGGELDVDRWQEGNLLVTQKSVTIANTHSNNGLQVTKTYTNHLGQVVKVKDAKGIEIAYTYDSSGNLATTIVANDPGSKVTLTHDVVGNKTRIVDPAAGVIDYRYNGFGELRVQTWAKGSPSEKRIETNYDKLGRVLRLREYKGDLNTDTIQKVYDQNWKGALWLEENANGAESFGHNSQGLVTRQGSSVAGDWKWMEHSYDSFGRLETSTYPDGTKIKQVYHTAGYHVQTLDITNGERLLWALGDDVGERGNYRYQLYGNNVITEQALVPENGSLGRIISGKVTNGSMASFKGTLQNYTYDWDSIGNLQSRKSGRVNSSGSVIENVTERFDYDNLNRLDKAETYGQSITKRTNDYRYDDFGNLTSNSNQQYGRINGASLYGVTRAKNKDYHYDVFGNVTRRGTTTIDYDVFNKPTRIGGTNFYYGTARQKVKQVTGSKTTEYFFGGKFEVEKNGTATITTLRIGNYLKKVSGSTVTEEFHLYDHVGSTDIITNAAGNSVQRMAFDAFGNRLEGHFSSNDSTASGSSNYKGYTGHDMLDHLGLIHMGGRVYDPDAGRFLSADLFVHNAYDTQSYNRYSYVRNNPLSRIDPNGYNECASGGRRQGCKANNLAKKKKAADAASKKAKRKANAIAARYRNAAAAGNKRAMAKLGSGAVNDMANAVYDEFMGEALGGLYGADFLTGGAEGGVVNTGASSGVAQKGGTDDMGAAGVVMHWLSGKGGNLYFGPGSKISESFSQGEGAQLLEDLFYQKFDGNPPNLGKMDRVDYRYTWDSRALNLNGAVQIVGTWKGHAVRANDRVLFRAENTMSLGSLTFGRQRAELAQRYNWNWIDSTPRASDLYMTIEWSRPLR